MSNELEVELENTVPAIEQNIDIIEQMVEPHSTTVLEEGGAHGFVASQRPSVSGISVGSQDVNREFDNRRESLSDRMANQEQVVNEGNDRIGFATLGDDNSNLSHEVQAENPPEQQIE